MQDEKIIEVTEEAWKRLRIEKALTDRTQKEIASEAILKQLGPDPTQDRDTSRDDTPDER